MCGNKSNMPYGCPKRHFHFLIALHHRSTSKNIVASLLVLRSLDKCFILVYGVSVKIFRHCNKYFIVIYTKTVNSGITLRASIKTLFILSSCHVNKVFIQALEARLFLVTQFSFSKTDPGSKMEAISCPICESR